MKRALVALALVFACAHATPAPSADPTLEWNAALAAVHRRGLSAARADQGLRRIETLWVEAAGGGRERFVIALDEGRAQVTREAQPAGTFTEDPAFAAEIATLAAARQGPPPAVPTHDQF